jgi:putative ABC transport system permease protein
MLVSGTLFPADDAASAFEAPYELISIHETIGAVPGQIDAFSWSHYVRWQSSLPQPISAIAAYLQVPSTIQTAGARDHGERIQTTAALVSDNFFEVLAARPVRGRLFSRQSDNVGNVVVLLDVLARQLGGDPVGQTIRVNGVPCTVIGVVPEKAAFPKGTALWKPVDLSAMDREDRVFEGVGRLSHGHRVAEANAAMTVVARAIDRSDAATKDIRGVEIRSLTEDLKPRASSFVWAVCAILLSCLLLGAVNLCVLFLTRAQVRGRDAAVRVALGASALHASLPSILEGAIVGVCGAVVGIMIAPPLAGLLAWAGISAGGDGVSVRLDVRGIGAAILAAMAVAGMLAAVSVWQFTRSSPFECLRIHSASSAGSANRFWRRLLVVSQVAIATILTSAMITLTLAARRLSEADPGFRADGLFVGTVALSAEHLKSPSAGIQVALDLSTRLQARGGVEAATAWAVSFPRLVPAGAQPLRAEGHDSVGIASVPMMSIDVLPGFFRTFDLSVLEGRGFLESDTQNSPAVAVVNQEFASRLWPNQSAIGKHFSLPLLAPRSGDITIVGVARNTDLILRSGSAMQFVLKRSFFPIVFRPLAQAGTRTSAAQPVPTVSLGVRFHSTPHGIPELLNETAELVDPTLRVDSIMSYTRYREYPRLSVSAGFITAVSSLALLVAFVGVVAVIHEAVRARSRELAIRAALGAPRSSLLALVATEGLVLAVVGLGLGIFTNIFFAEPIQRLFFAVTENNARGILFGIDPASPGRLIAILATLAGMMLATSLFAGRRSLAIPPASALKAE